MKRLLSTLWFGIVVLSPIWGQERVPLSAVLPVLETYLDKAMAAEGVPGAVIVVVKDGKIAYLKGFGVKVLGTTEPVDEHTPFAWLSKAIQQVVGVEVGPVFFVHTQVHHKLFVQNASVLQELIRFLGHNQTINILDVHQTPDALFYDKTHRLGLKHVFRHQTADFLSFLIVLHL